MFLGALYELVLYTCLLTFAAYSLPKYIIHPKIASEHSARPPPTSVLYRWTWSRIVWRREEQVATTWAMFWFPLLMGFRDLKSKPWSCLLVSSVILSCRLWIHHSVNSRFYRSITLLGVTSPPEETANVGKSAIQFQVHTAIWTFLQASGPLPIDSSFKQIDVFLVMI